MKTVLLALLLAPAAAESPAPARLSGRVRGEPHVPPEKTGADARAYGDRVPAAAARLDYDRLRDVVVYALPEGGEAPAAAEPPVLFTLVRGRRGVEFRPRFAAAPAGAARWRNGTRSTLRVYAGDGASAATLRPGEEAALGVRGAPGSALLLHCLESPEAEATLLLTGAHRALAEEDGRYSLELPAGRWRLTAWHRRLPPAERSVLLRPGEAATADLVLGVRGLPEVPQR